MKRGSIKKRIVFIQYSNPGCYPPLVHSSGILAEQGWKALFLGTGAMEANSLDIAPQPNIVVRKMRFCPPGWKQKVHYLWFHVWCFAWVLVWRPSWIYASDMLACSPTLLIHLLLRIPFIYHEHDSPDSVKSWFGNLNLWARRQCARWAEVCVIPNKFRAERFRLETGTSREIKVVWNCPRLGEVSDEPHEPRSTLYLLYHGSIVPERLPLSVIEALARVTSPVLLKIVGYETAGSPGYLARLREKADELHIGDRLQIVGTVPLREDLMAICRGCDIGLSLLASDSGDLNMCHMTGASNKPFDYLACGLAVLVPNSPEWRELYVEPGYGLECAISDPASIAAAIQWFCDHAEEMRMMGRRGRDRIRREWNYEAQFAAVAAVLDEKSNPKLSAEVPVGSAT